ncbi:MAG TPA: ABC transporter ATP-binding protein [Anaerolineae bacterium]|nr:ABC transporter ATP-binding protein [Anaerolineae bacterium]
MTGAPIISLDRLRFSYETSQADVLQDLSLEIPPGTITAILGPNGAGKTTLLHVILGLLQPHAGQVRIAGRPQTGYSRTELSRLVGLVLQAEYSPFNFSVLEYVLLGRTPYLSMLSMPSAEDYRLAQQALDTLDLAALKDRPITELSGGERQMVMLARAIAQQTPILLLDEPTAHLDLSNKGRFLAVLRTLAGQGVTLIFTTHEPEVAVAAAGYLVLMRAGQVLDSGPLPELLTAEKLSATYGVPIRVAQVEGRPVVLLG